jgi:hypothetical protein
MSKALIFFPSQRISLKAKILIIFDSESSFNLSLIEKWIWFENEFQLN